MNYTEAAAPEDRRHEIESPPSNRLAPIVHPGADNGEEARTGEGVQLTLGEVLREDGIARVELGTDSWWKSCCDAGIAELARRGVIFQAADLLDIGVPEPDSANRWGTRMLAAARAGLIEPVGYGPSKRPTTACSAVRLWRGRTPSADGDAA